MFQRAITTALVVFHLLMGIRRSRSGWISAPSQKSHAGILPRIRLTIEASRITRISSGFGTGRRVNIQNNVQRYASKAFDRRHRQTAKRAWPGLAGHRWAPPGKEFFI